MILPPLVFPGGVNVFYVDVYGREAISMSTLSVKATGNTGGVNVFYVDVYGREAISMSTLSVKAT